MVVKNLWFYMKLLFVKARSGLVKKQYLGALRFRESLRVVMSGLENTCKPEVVGKNTYCNPGWLVEPFTSW